MNVKLMELCSCIEGSILVLSEPIMKIKLKAAKDDSSPWIAGRNNLRYNEVCASCMQQNIKSDGL